MFSDFCDLKGNRNLKGTFLLKLWNLEKNNISKHIQRQSSENRKFLITSKTNATKGITVYATKVTNKFVCKHQYASLTRT